MIRFCCVEVGTPEELEELKAILSNFDLPNEYIFSIEKSEKQNKRCVPSDRFLSQKEKIKKDNTVLRYEKNKKIYFVDKLPDFPGVYLFHDKNGSIIYVGSTKKLSQRIPQSFIERNGEDTVQKISYRITNSVEEARDLEAVVINKLKPKLNTIVPPMPTTNIDLHKLSGYVCKVETWSED